MEKLVQVDGGIEDSLARGNGRWVVNGWSLSDLLHTKNSSVPAWDAGPILPRMFRAFRLLQLLLASVVVGTALAGCIGYDDCIKPITGMITNPIGGGSRGVSVGACAAWVGYNGIYYRDMRSEGHAFDLTEDQLVPVGEASGATDLVGPLGGATVFEIAGVEPDEAVAMRAPNGSDQPFVVLAGRNGDGYGFPQELCPFLVNAETDESAHAICGDDR